MLPCDGETSNHLFTGQVGDREVQANEFGVQSCTSLEGDSEQLSEVSIGEVDSLLLIDDEGESARDDRQLACYVMAGSGDHRSVLSNTKTQFDFVHHVAKEEPATVSYDVDVGSSSSSEEDDTGDATWSCSTRTTRLHHRRRRRRSHIGRCLSAARNRMADERKKQQNKSAATRYREKKRSEEMENELLCAALERRNKELHTRVQDMTQEVAVLRQLVIDVFRSGNVCS